ncbi:MAG: hypothetical protein MZV63_23025 [Marinilabiliales bacterium]|nr:hypothetical protein [Marinilabiliales bacterium]
MPKRDGALNEFLGYCARDKAGIGWDGWKDKDTEIFVYEAYVFGDQEVHVTYHVLPIGLTILVIYLFYPLPLNRRLHRQAVSPPLLELDTAGLPSW